MLGLVLVLAVYGILAATIIGGGIFIWRVSGKEQTFKGFLKAIFGWVRYFANPRFLVSFLLIVAGLGLMIHSYTVTSTVFEQVTGYKYLLGEQPIYWWMDGWILTVYKYRLYEYPVKTWAIFYDTYFEPLQFFSGLALIIAGLYLGAYWLAKATNRAYGIR